MRTERVRERCGRLDSLPLTLQPSIGKDYLPSMSRVILVVALAVLLSGCGQGETAVAPAPSRAATRARAADDVDLRAAGALVSRLYERHAGGDSPFFQTDREKARMYFEPALADLIVQDVIDSEGEAGAIDFDPLYDAQDTEIKDFAVHPAIQERGGGVRVVVTFQNFGAAERLTYRLVPVARQWRIADIEYKDARTLRGILTPARGGA
jgi:uncharacterized protein YceK